MDLVEILRAEGLEVEDHRRSGASGPYKPIGQMIHHTASPADAGPAPSLGYIRDGAIAAPLCQVLWGRDLVARVITDGKANHAGLGAAAVLARLISGQAPLGDARVVAPKSDVVGNAFFVGHEIENDGTGEPWPDELVDVVCRGAAAIARAEGWTERTTILHREWTARKIDPNHLDGPAWRTRVAGWLMPALHVPSIPLEDEVPYLMIVDRRTDLPAGRPVGAVYAMFESGKVRHIGGAEFTYLHDKLDVPVVDASPDGDHAEAERLYAQT